MKYVAAAALYFIALAHRGLFEDFNTDDTMNLGVSFLKPLGVIVKGALLFWTGYIRPLGGLFYLAVYSYAGFWSAPFRVACFALIILNLWLLWRLFRKLGGGSRQFAPLALLVVCFHAGMSDIYLSTGTIYDILCQTFFLLALSSSNLAVIALCTIAAVDAKEVGVAIPAVILAYELIFNGRRFQWPRVAVSGAVALIFMWSRLLQPNELTNHPSYKVTLTLHQYLLTTTNYINQLVSGPHLNQAAALALFLLPLALALALRSRLMLFGWFYYVLALAPMCFSLPRPGYALYIPYTGIAILLAALVVKIGSTKATAAFAGLVIAFQIWQSATKLHNDPYGHVPIYTIAEGVRSRYPSMPKHSSLLLVNDPLVDDDFGPAFILSLLYHDPTLRVARASWSPASGPFEFPAVKYDHIFLFAGTNAFELKPGGDDGGPLPFTTMNSPHAARSIVKDIGGIGPGEQMRWVNQDPTLAFRVPSQPAQFHMDFDVPDIILHDTGPLRMQCWIAEKPAPPLTITKAGAHRYDAPLPAGLRTGEVVVVRFHIANPYIAKGDGARLSFLLRDAGFQSP